MRLQRKKEKANGYAVGISAEVYKQLEEIKAKAENKLSLQTLATELLKEAIANIEWYDEEKEEKDVPLEKLMKERI